MTENGTPVHIRHCTDPGCPFAFSAERQRHRHRHRHRLRRLYEPVGADGYWTLA